MTIERSGTKVIVRGGRWGDELSELRSIDHSDEASAVAAESAISGEYEGNGYLHSASPEPRAARFYREEFTDLLALAYGVKRGEVSTALVDETEEIYGQKMPPELRDHLVFRGSSELGYCNFGEWSIWAENLIPFDSKKENLFEQLLSDFATYTLKLMLADLVEIGTAGNGDTYLAAIDVRLPEASVVFMFDHETGEIAPFADTLSTLAELNRLYEINAGNIEVEGDLLAEVERGMKRIEKRVSPSWHYEELVGNSETKPSFEPKGELVTFMWFRGSWIAALMEGDVREAANWFKPLIEWHQKNMTWTDSKKRWTTLVPSRGLYWLYYLYFFESPDLGEAIELCSKSASRILRDAATTFAKLAKGQTHIGNINFAETRKRFLALGVDPAKAEELKRAADAAKTEKAARQAAERTEIAAWVKDKSTAQIAEELWRRVDSPAAAKALASALIDKDPSLSKAYERARAAIAREENWPLAVEALQLAATAEERSMLAFALACSGPSTVAAVVSVLRADERDAIHRHGKTFLARLRTWLRAEYLKQYAIESLSVLGALSNADLDALMARLRWVDEKSDDEDEEEREEQTEISASTFGGLQTGLAALAKQGDEAKDLQEESKEEESEEEKDEDSEEESEEQESEDSNEESEEENESEDDESEDGSEEDESEEEEESDDDDESEEQESEDESEKEEADPHDVNLEDETPLAETPSYLLSTMNKAPLRATIEAFALHPPPGALDKLRAIVLSGPKELIVPALLAIGRLPGDDARLFLEQQLGGVFPDQALCALARRGGAAALPAVEDFFERTCGLPDVTVYPRLMREAVRSSAGKPVDLEVVRLSLRTVMDNKFAARELHEIALDLLGKHAEPLVARQTALAFLDDEHSSVRDAARRLLVRIDGDSATSKIRVLDDKAIAEIHSKEGVLGLAAALKDEWSVHRDRVLGFAVEHGFLAQLEREALALVRHMARFPFYTNGYKRDGLERADAAIQHLSKLETPEVDHALHAFLTSPNPAVRKAFEYNKALVERLRKIGPIESESAMDAVAGRDLSRGVEARSLLDPLFVLGEAVHGIAFTKDAVIVAGAGRVTAFDRDGRPHPRAEAFADGWGYDVVVHEAAGLIVVGYSHGHCIVHALEDFARKADLSHGFPGVRKVAISPSGRWLATACDDKTLHVWDLESLTEARVHKELFDVNSVAWVDEDTIAFITDQHVGVLPRVKGEARRAKQKMGGAEIQVIDGLLLAGGSGQDLTFFDGKTLEAVESLPIRGVARARVSKDRKTVFVACWEGKMVGFSRWNRDTKKAERSLEESLFGMEIDPETNRIFVGGKSHRVTILSPEGKLESGAPELREDQKSGTRWMVVPAGGDSIAKIARTENPDEIDILDGAGRVVRYSMSRDLGAVVAVAPRPLPRTAEDFAVVDAGIVTSAFGAVARYGRGTVEPWSRTTDRSEKVIAIGGIIVTGSGKHLGWLDPASGELLAERDAGVKSSWVQHLYAVGDDRFFVAGYDEGRLQLWSACERRRVGEIMVDHREHDGRFSRPYGIRVHPASRRVAVTYWDKSVDVFAIEGDRFVLEHTLRLQEAYEFVALGDDGKTIVIGSAREVLALSYPDCVPRWRWSSSRELTALEVLPDGRVVVGCKDGSVLVVPPSAHEH
ncbi:MAG: hypothetical protein FWD69_17160 [Polyangiaceae bacterium]|nr:hypothetical protein [Polyangiaceae bacterium]